MRRSRRSSRPPQKASRRVASSLSLPYVFELTVPCRRCERRQRIRFEDQTEGPVPLVEASWTCAYCGATNGLGAVGVATVLHTPTDEPTKS
jgi:hypothetical protein